MDSVVGKNLSKTFGEGPSAVRALRHVDIALSRGSVSALLGPSGSGKSTLIKALGMVDLPDTGSIWLHGKEIVREGVAMTDVAALRRQELGFVFQKANLISFLSARQNIEIAAEVGHHEDPRGRADELLKYLDVSNRASAMPHELSGGEQQRIAIARALANSPSLILADEPTAALDSVRGRAVMELMRQVAHEQGAAVLVVTHDQRSLDVFDVIWKMEDGALDDGHGTHQTD